MARRVSLTGVQLLAAGWLTVLVLAALLPPSLQPVAQLNLDHLNQAPSRAHWLGTDPFGRDVLADLLAGARSLLTVGVPGALLASGLGVVLGAAAGYWADSGLRLRRGVLGALGLGGMVALLLEPTAVPWAAAPTLAAAGWLGWGPWPTRLVALPLDRLVLGATTLLSAVPRLVLVLVLAALHEPSRLWLMLLMGLICWPPTATLTRVLVRQQRQQPYVEAGYAAGYSAARLLWRHLLPNVWPSLRAVVPLNLSICLGLQTTLTFLGVGLPPDQSDWGRALANARLEPGAWWLIASSLTALTLTILSLRLLLPTNPRTWQI